MTPRTSTPPRSSAAVNRHPTHRETALHQQDTEELSSPCFSWGEVDGHTFANVLTTAYNEVVNWRRNVFSVPSGSAGKEFIREQARLFNAYAEKSALEPLAIRAAMTMPILLLQKPHRSSKAKEHRICLQRRMEAWKSGNIDVLIQEGHTIQQRLPSHHPIPHPQATSSLVLLRNWSSREKSKQLYDQLR